MTAIRCIHCREILTRDLIALRVRTCGRCAVLLRELGDAIADPPAREPGCDDRPGPFTTIIACSRGDVETRMDAEPTKPINSAGPNPKRDGRWLAMAAAKRKQFPFFHDYGHAHGFDRDIRRWTPDQVEMAVQAIQAKKANA